MARDNTGTPFQSIKLGVQFNRNGKGYYEGTHEHREAVLLKRKRGDHITYDQIQDYELLEQHPNVCRFHGKETVDDVQTAPKALGNVELIAFETSKMNLLELESGEIIDAMKGVAEGLMHIHQVGYVVHDFTVDSIILVGKYFKHDLKPTVKISLEECKPYLVPKDGKKISKVSPLDNLVQLGDIFASFVTGFKENSDDLIASNPSGFHLCQHRLEALDLIALLQGRKIKEAKTVLQHPLFWSSKKRLDFMTAVNDFMHRNRNLRRAIDNLKSEVFDGHWLEKAKLGESVYTDYKDDENETKKNYGENAKQYENTVSDLVKAIRNKNGHLQDAGSDARAEFLRYDSTDIFRGFDLFMQSKFPNLFMLVYGVVCSDSTVSSFKSFNKYKLVY